MSRYYWGKLDRVVYPLLVWAAITHTVMSPDFRLLDPLAYLGPYHLWFILFLALFYAVAPLLERVNAVYVVLAALALSWLSPDDSKYLERLFCLMAFFFFGHLIGHRADLLARLTTARMAWLSLPVAVALSVFAVSQGRDVSYGPLLFAPVSCGIVVLVVVARALTERGHVEPLAFLGRHSLVFYVSHFPLIYLVMGATLQSGLGLPLVGLVSFATSLGVGTALALLSEESALVRGLFQRPSLTRVPSLR